MKSRILCALALWSGVVAWTASAQSTQFTYQGRISLDDAAYNGVGQLKLALVDSGIDTSVPALATGQVTSGFLTAIAVTQGGAGYTQPPAVTIKDASGFGAVATATVAGGVVTAIQVVNAGSGYSAQPLITVAPPPPNLVYVTHWSHDGTSVAGSEPSTSVPVTIANGLLTLEVGDAALANMNPLPAQVFLTEALRLRLWFSDGVQAFTQLSPDQALNPSPYAVSALQLLGTLPPAALAGHYGEPLELTNPANHFVGDGSGLTQIDAGALASGTIPLSRLPADLALTSGVWLRRGNAGTSAAVDFVGTQDATPLVFRANNHEVMRLEAVPTGVRVIAGRNTLIDGTSTNASILGGRDNVIQGSAHESVIAGGFDNTIGPEQRSAFIGGGARNEILLDNQHAVIAGGRDNRIGTNTVISIVVGGGENRIGNNVDGGLMVGGFRNDILGSPNPNRRAIAPVLVGGSDNEIGRESSWAVILGGDNNRIGTNCASAVIAGGTNNLVADNCGFSFAAGRRSRVNHPGAFIWADSQNASYASAGVNTFNIRAEGGVHLSGDTSMRFGSTVRQMLNLYGTAYGIGVQSSTAYFRTASTGSFSWHRGGTHSNTANSPGSGGVEMMRLNSGGLRVNGTFVSASDRNLKEAFRPVDPGEVLEKLSRIPIGEWNYREDPSARHVGPVAQDFHAAFGLGSDDRHIATVDADGIALVAIQGLHRKVRAENEALRSELVARDSRIAELESRLARLETVLSLDAPGPR